MKTNVKFHTIAIAAIIVIVTALYFALGAPKAPRGGVVGDTSGRAIEIYSATWGEACNPAIAAEIATRKNTPIGTRVGNANASTASVNPASAGHKNLSATASTTAISADDLKPVTPNNALEAVGNVCNGALACDLRADDESLGVSPLRSCFKRLVVSYRCFNFDRLNTLDVGQGEHLRIDCSPQPNTADATTPAAR